MPCFSRCSLPCDTYGSHRLGLGQLNIFGRSATEGMMQSGPAASSFSLGCVPVSTETVKTPAFRPSSTSTTVSPTFTTLRGSDTPNCVIAAVTMIGSGLPAPRASDEKYASTVQPMLSTIAFTVASGKPDPTQILTPRFRSSSYVADVPVTSVFINPVSLSSSTLNCLNSASTSASSTASVATPFVALASCRRASRFSYPRTAFACSKVTS
mmetsp:Transcript_97428/g.160327  ORF Transcript_97428/g.160327 Transcript_97428/m.160327 type:complete len:211 (-) Transcript_97428:250-882(-)